MSHQKPRRSEGHGGGCLPPPPPDNFMSFLPSSLSLRIINAQRERKRGVYAICCSLLNALLTSELDFLLADKGEFFVISQIMNDMMGIVSIVGDCFFVLLRLTVVEFCIRHFQT
jgi:hypothetical protein